MAIFFIKKCVNFSFKNGVYTYKRPGAPPRYFKDRGVGKGGGGEGGEGCNRGS